MIILEGCDNTGKSTLAAQLSKALSIPVRHSIRPAPRATALQCLEHSARQLRPQRIILDRIYAISENVYGPTIRGSSQMGDKAAEAILDLYQRPYLIIYCRPPLETILKNGGRDQMPGVLDHHAKLVERYDEVIQDVVRFSHCRVMQYDWTNKIEFPAVLEACVKHIKTYDQSTWSSTFLG